MKRFLFSILSFLVMQVVTAQQKTITGTVTSMKDTQPLADVSVLVKGARKGTTTDASGKFSITVPSNAKSLIFTFVGFNTQEISLGNSTAVNVVLVEGTETL